MTDDKLAEWRRVPRLRCCCSGGWQRLPGACTAGLLLSVQHSPLSQQCQPHILSYTPLLQGGAGVCFEVVFVQFSCTGGTVNVSTVAVATHRSTNVLLRCVLLTSVR